MCRERVEQMVAIMVAQGREAEVIVDDPAAKRYKVVVRYLDIRHVFSCTAKGDITVDEEADEDAPGTDRAAPQ